MLWELIFTPTNLVLLLAGAVFGLGVPALIIGLILKKIARKS